MLAKDAYIVSGQAGKQKLINLIQAVIEVINNFRVIPEKGRFQVIVLDNL